MLLLPSIRSGGTLPYSGYTSSDGIIHGDLAAIDPFPESVGNVADHYGIQAIESTLQMQ
jgi:hypothetical protein